MSQGILVGSMKFPADGVKLAKVGIYRVDELPEVLESFRAPVQKAKYCRAHDSGGVVGSTIPMRRVQQPIF